MTNSTLHRTLVTKHETVTYEGTDGRITVRKQAGQFILKVERYDPAQVTTMPFKTMRGALIALEGAKGLV